MKIIRNAFLGACALALLAGPFVTSAISVTELQAKIQELLTQIDRLQSQSTQAVSTAAMPIKQHRVCGLLNRNISIGSRGDDVTSLQEYLQEEGYLSATATGYYGQLTAQAVSQWQLHEGISSVGAVGPLSRTRIEKHCGDQTYRDQFSANITQGPAPLTVEFRSWISGFRSASVYYTIDFGDGVVERAENCPAPADACVSAGKNVHTYTANGIYVATLSKITDPCAGNPVCKAAMQTEVVAKQEIQVGTSFACTKEYSPVCGSKQVTCVKAPCNPVQTTYGNSCLMKADGATRLYEGACISLQDDPSHNPQCKAWNDGCNTCSRLTPESLAACTLMYCEVPSKAYCTEYFNADPNKPPVISGLLGPSTLVATTTGQWTIYSYDPEGGSLGFSITWGDEVQMASAKASSTKTFVQTTLFTHSYSKPGTYTITMVVQDDQGAQAKTSTTVKVSSGIVCNTQYIPVCGRPTGCMNTCPAGMYCAAVCMQYPVQTFTNRCQLEAAEAEYVSAGQCVVAI